MLNDSLLEFVLDIALPNASDPRAGLGPFRRWQYRHLRPLEKALSGQRRAGNYFLAGRGYRNRSGIAPTPRKPDPIKLPPLTAPARRSHK